MFAAVLAVGLTAQPPAPPAPLPDRWLLKLAPADLPRTPDMLTGTVWYDAFHSRAIGRAWERWVEFRPAHPGGPATAAVTKLNERAAFVPGEPAADPVYRVVPLAVHGPLVEFDRQLYTAVVRPVRDGVKGRPTQRLHLGAAVALKDHVWYQAGTRTARDGKAVAVEEWRLEFRDDPRAADAGAVRVRGYRRELTAVEGEATDLELRFTAKPPDDRTRSRLVTLVPPAGAKGPRLPYLQLGVADGDADVIWTDGWDRLVLTVATRPAPVRVEPGAPGLVQPPKRP